MVLDTGFEVVCAGVVAGAPVVPVVVDCVTGFGVIGCAGFLAILKRVGGEMKETYLAVETIYSVARSGCVRESML